MLLYQDDPKKLNQFFIKLLKPLPGWRLINHENWFESLAKEYKKRDLEADFVSDVPATSSTILTIPLRQRLEILRNLCEFHLEQPEHFWELLKVKDGEADWRIEPIGKDSQNRRYWLFSDARMYREIAGAEEKIVKNSKKQKVNTDDSLPWDIEDESNWELVCLTRADYDEFLTSAFPAPLKPKDKVFLKMIREEIIPQVEPILSYQLSQHKKYFRPVASERIFLMPRKRSSRLLEKELEDEQRRVEEQAAEKERRKLMNESLPVVTVGAPAKSREEVEKDLAAEREMRAEMRRSKKEKEMQIKAIEEAFYSSYDPEQKDDDKDNNGSSGSSDVGKDIVGDVEIISEDEKEMIPKSPIKLVLKMNMKPVDTTEDIEAVTSSLSAPIDVVDEVVDIQADDTKNAPLIVTETVEHGVSDPVLISDEFTTENIVEETVYCTENSTCEPETRYDEANTESAGNIADQAHPVSEEDAQLLFNYQSMNNI